MDRAKSLVEKEFSSVQAYDDLVKSYELALANAAVKGLQLILLQPNWVSQISMLLFPELLVRYRLRKVKPCPQPLSLRLL